MVEFRSRIVEPDKEEQGGTFEKHLDRVIENIRNDPEIQGQLLQELQESDINPAFLKAVTGMEIPQQTQEEPAEEPAEQPSKQPPQTRIKKVTEKPTPDQLIAFLGEVQEYTDEGMTLGELSNWAEENKDLVKTAIELKF